MPRFIWIAIGLLTGLFARTIAGKRGPKGLFDIALALIGALIGAWLFGLFDYASPASLTELGENNILIDVIGSATLLVVILALTRSTD